VEDVEISFATGQTSVKRLSYMWTEAWKMLEDPVD